MTTLDQIVDVQITRQTQTVSQAGFGTLLIVGTFKNWNNRIKFYSSMQEVAVDFDPEQPEYQAALAVFSQSPSPNRIAIGRRNADSATVEIISAMTGKTYTVTINGTNYSITTTNTTQESTVTFSADFVASNSIAITLNGNVLTPVVYSTSQLFTMTAIQTLLEAQPGIDSVEILPDGANPNRKLKINTETNLPGIVNSAVVTLGASQPTATIVNNNQPTTIESIADKLVTAIGSPTGITVTNNDDGTFDIDATVSGTPFTLAVSNNIVNANSGIITVTDATPNALYSMKLDGISISYTAPNDVADVEQIAADFVSQINASSLAITATDNFDGTFSIESNDPLEDMIVQLLSNNLLYAKGLIIAPLVPTETITDALDAIQSVDDTWYALAITDRTPADVLQAAAWIEAQVKIFGTASSDPDIINLEVQADNTSIAKQLFDLGYQRTFILYHQDADTDFPECAWFGKCLPFTPGSETWAFKTLATVSYSDLSTTQSNNAHNKNTNTYEYVGGVGITQDGVVSQGEYIDIIRGVDWLTSTIQVYVYSILVNLPKVPYTDAGITAVEAQVRRALDEGVNNNFIAADPEYTVTVPKAIDVSPADKAARLLKNVVFHATLAGAIQMIQIRGTVTV